MGSWTWWHGARWGFAANAIAATVFVLLGCAVPPTHIGLGGTLHRRGDRGRWVAGLEGASEWTHAGPPSLPPSQDGSEVCCLWAPAGPHPVGERGPEPVGPNHSQPVFGT